MVNLDDTTGCPVGARCETCGATQALAVVTADCPAGVYCLTLCLACEQLAPPEPAGGWPSATRRVLGHCAHLGLDADQMAAVLRDERGAGS